VDEKVGVGLRMTGVTWTAVVMIVASLFVLKSWTLWSNSRSWTLVDMVPISLSQGTHHISGELPVNMTGRYSIVIYAENKIDPTELECILGVMAPGKYGCDSTTSILRAKWVLTDGAKLFEGKSDDTVGYGGGGPGPHGADRLLGNFQGEKGHRYKLDIFVLSDSGNLNVTNPRLYVGVQDASLVSDLVVSGLLRAVCLAITSIGGLMLIGSFVAQRRQRTRTPAKSASKDAS
jgi:hypothetical protein